MRIGDISNGIQVSTSLSLFVNTSFFFLFVFVNTRAYTPDNQSYRCVCVCVYHYEIYSIFYREYLMVSNIYSIDLVGMITKIKNCYTYSQAERVDYKYDLCDYEYG